MKSTGGFDTVLFGIARRLKPFLENLPPEIKQSTEEIRLRAELPLAVTVKGESFFVLESGQTSETVAGNAVKVAKSDIEESFKLLCASSLFAHERELKNGYIMIKNGHRAGVCGTYGESGIPHNISSLNIRIAHQIAGAADSIIKNYKGGGILIAGPPGSGKTTVLRDLIRQLSCGEKSFLKRIAVIDNRGEISGSYNGICFNDLGKNTDVLITADKALGIEIAVRTMFPQIIAFDEISTEAELKAISQCFYCGVDVITTAHIGSIQELKSRKITEKLLGCGVIGTVVFLKNNSTPPVIYYNKL